jgi:hypothetical protein
MAGATRLLKLRLQVSTHVVSHLVPSHIPQTFRLTMTIHITTTTFSQLFLNHYPLATLRHHPYLLQHRHNDPSHLYAPLQIYPTQNILSNPNPLAQANRPTHLRPPRTKHTRPAPPAPNVRLLPQHTHPSNTRLQSRRRAPNVQRVQQARVRQASRAATTRSSMCCTASEPRTRTGPTQLPTAQRPWYAVTRYLSRLQQVRNRSPDHDAWLRTCGRSEVFGGLADDGENGVSCVQDDVV